MCRRPCPGISKQGGCLLEIVSVLEDKGYGRLGDAGVVPADLGAQYDLEGLVVVLDGRRLADEVVRELQRVAGAADLGGHRDGRGFLKTNK